MKVSQGDVVIGPDFVGGNSRRPYIVISNGEHPFSDEEFLAVLVTTTEREEAVPLPEEKFKDGELPKESFASPWTVTTLKTGAVHRKIGGLKGEAVEEISNQVTIYLRREQ